VRVYDSAEPVARRVSDLLAAEEVLASLAVPEYHFYTTGDTARFAAQSRLLIDDCPIEPLPLRMGEAARTP
jgi:glutamate racemase